MKRIAFLAATLLLSFLCHAQDELIFQRNFDGESEGVSRGPFENLQLVKSPPQSGTFWSLQLSNSLPPFPANPFPELPVYSWGSAYIFDDWDVDWVAIREQGFPLFRTTNTNSSGEIQMAARQCQATGVEGQMKAGRPIRFRRLTIIQPTIFGWK